MDYVSVKKGLIIRRVDWDAWLSSNVSQLSSTDENARDYRCLSIGRINSCLLKKLIFLGTRICGAGKGGGRGKGSNYG